MRTRGFIKENAKLFNDDMVVRELFVVGQKALYKSRLMLQAGKFRFRWLGPFFIIHIFPHGAIEIQSLDTNKIFEVNEHRLKIFYEGDTMTSPIVASLERPTHRDR